MCGIAGIVSDSNINNTILLSMTDALKHRGPDDGGTKIVSGQRGRFSAGLGHRRLSIIDLSPLGHQPMSNEDETVWITFNGEIYNYKELKNDLSAKGHVFRSESDTEVIVHGYEEYGNTICKKLSGMFAFAIWDTKKELLLLARDRFGKKPLYYWKNENGIVFSSEIKSFLKHPEFNPSLNVQSLSMYLAFEYVPVPHSIYKQVNKLAPGCYLQFDGTTSRIEQYWDVSFTASDKSVKTQESLENELLSLLKKSVEKRLMSDVALGAFLSGGIDSSAVVALMADIIDPHLIKTFSIGFEDKSFDESNYARHVASHFKTDHHEKIFTAKDMFDILPDVWNFLDEPFADASILPTYMLSKFTRETVTVALGGDGGDELFAGYDPFLAHKFANVFEKIPSGIAQNILSPLVSCLPVSHKNMSLDFKLKQFLKGIEYPLSVRNQVWLGAFAPYQQKELFCPDIAKDLATFDIYQDIRQAKESHTFRDWVDEITFMYERFYMGEDILTKVDRASMAVSLEVRTPFLDLEFSEFANSLPANFKLHGLTRKYILKKALEKKLPKEIIYRKKKGFGIPLTKWLRYDLRPMLEETFSKERVQKEGLFNFAYINTLMQEHFDGKRDNRKQLWTLLMFEKWKDRFGG